VKIKILSLVASLLIISGCTVFEETIDAGKNVASAVVDESVDLGQTVISIPVQAAGTVIDKLEEETVDEMTDE
tara:strand:- start:277 stop:495 length:219 start_codon:yes stop_codon:yes gene_type:complete